MNTDFEIIRNSTSQRLPVWLADSSSTTGAGLQSLVAASSGLKAFYWREDSGSGTATPISLVTATPGAFTASGFIAKDNANVPGEYELGLPNAVLTTGAKWARVMLFGATNLAPKVISIRINQSFDPDNANIGTVTTVVTANDVLRVGTATVVTTANDVLRVGTASLVATVSDVLRVGTASLVATVNDALRVGTASIVAGGTIAVASDVLRVGTASVVATANDVLRVGTASLVATVNDALRVGTVSVVAVANFPTNFTAMSISAGGLVDILQGAADKVWSTTTRVLSRNAGIKKNTALAGYQFLMTDSTSHSPATGLTVTATRSLDGAAFGACANSPTEIGSGWYTIDLAAADLNGNTVGIRFTATGADDAGVSIVTM